MVFATSLSDQQPLLFILSSLQARTVSAVIILHSHRNGSGDGGKKTGLDEKLPRRVFNPLPYFAMLRRPFWRSPYCGGVLYTRSGTTYALERLLDRRASSYTGINAQVTVLRLSQLHCVLRLCRQLRYRSSRNILVGMAYGCDGSRGSHMTGLQSAMLHSKQLRRLIHGYGLEGDFCLFADP